MPDDRARRIAEAIKPLRVKTGTTVHLGKDFDPRYKADLIKKQDGRELLQTGVELLAEYQARLAAQDVHAVLVCLQALDAGGKDGTIRHVMTGVNPQGVHVSSFKAPSPEELDHDYLWRYARRDQRHGGQDDVVPARAVTGARPWRCPSTDPVCSSSARAACSCSRLSSPSTG